MTIRLLPPRVANAIAAGEVVERPAAVVKELVENSLDAGATRIHVSVRGAGRTLISVRDDGSGIPPDELVLAFQRHATSKVRDLEDLARIRTLGFRGEALASIAAVGRVECRSRGRYLRLEAGEVTGEGAAAGEIGTLVEVRDLFLNTPARLQFLKSDQTELSLIVRTVAAQVLCFPEVRFELLVDGRRALGSEGAGIIAAAAAVLRIPAGDLVEVSRLDQNFTVSGLIAPAAQSRPNRDGMYLSVNRRPIVSRQLTFAVEDAFRGRLERGRFPICALAVEVDPAAVDVNVHPTKREVRFRDEGRAFGAVQRAVRDALSGTGPRVYHLVQSPAALRESAVGVLTQLEIHDRVADSRVSAAEIPGTQPVLRPVGQVQDGYLLAEGGDGLVLVDQHAAHERILFNGYLARLRNGGVQRQQLLLPAVVDVSLDSMQVVAREAERLTQLGFEVEAFGPRSVRVLAAPAELSAGRVEEACVELLQLLAEPDAATGHDDHALAASLACHSAVRFGDLLGEPEQRRLLVELAATADAETCPHGRPTSLVLGWQDVKRHFRRNY